MSICHCIFTLALDKYTRVLVLSDVQWLVVVTILKKVKKLVIVDLQEGAIDREVIWSHIWVPFLYGSLVNLVDRGENLLNCSRDYT